MTYKGLLLRTQALIEKDPEKQQELLREGTALSDKANAMRKAKPSSRLAARALRGDRPIVDRLNGPVAAEARTRPVFSFTCTSLRE